MLVGEVPYTWPTTEVTESTSCCTVTCSFSILSSPTRFNSGTKRFGGLLQAIPILKTSISRRFLCTRFKTLGESSRQEGGYHTRYVRRFGRKFKQAYFSLRRVYSISYASPNTLGLLLCIWLDSIPEVYFDLKVMFCIILLFLDVVLHILYELSGFGRMSVFCMCS